MQYVCPDGVFGMRMVANRNGGRANYPNPLPRNRNRDGNAKEAGARKRAIGSVPHCAANAARGGPAPKRGEVS